MLVSRRISILLAIVSSPAWASAVNASLDLNSFSINPASGSAMILPGTNVLVFAQSLDSLSGLDQNFNAATDAPASTSASTTLGNASDAASGLTLTGSVVENVNILAMTAFASAEAQATLSGMFEITGATSPVNVTFNASLLVSQFVMTDAAGVSANSEATLTLAVAGVQSVLSFDNPLNAGSNQTISYFASPMVTASLDVPANMPLSYTVSMDVENKLVSMVPEPSSLLLAAAGALAVVGRRCWRSKHRV